MNVCFKHIRNNNICEVVCRKRNSTHTHMPTSKHADHGCDVTKATNVHSMPYTTIVAAALLHGVGVAATASVVAAAVVVAATAATDDDFDVVAFLRC